MTKKDSKTNVMRILEQKGIEYRCHEYDASDGAKSGVEVASLIGRDVSQVFKTLVTVGASKEHYVFVIPAEATLDLRKAARAVGEKNIAMIKQSELLPLTGYIHGGCSPIGMKKAFTTVFHEDIILIDTVIVSAGRIGLQVEVRPEEIISLTGASVCDVAVS